MAVSLTGTGGFFTRAGAILAGVNEACASTGSTLTSRVSTIAAQYASNEQPTFAPTWAGRDGTRTVFTSWVQSLYDLVGNTLIEQVDRDTALPSRDVSSALFELIRQMKASGDSLNRPTLGATVTAGGTNTGNTSLKVSTTDADGLPLDCLFAETIQATVSGDVGTGSTEFSEPITLRGDTAVQSVDYNWPAGSGGFTIIPTVDPNVDGLIVNGGFNTWTVTNVPDNWSFANSTVAGTHVTRQAGSVRTSDTYCCRLTSDGSTLITLRQTPSSTLLPLTVYAVTLSAKINTVDATGALRIALVDSTGTVVNDAASTANSYSLGVNGGSGIGTSYAQFTTFFRTPAKVPSGLSLEIKLTTSPTSGRTIDLDLVQLSQATQLYAGGPYFAAFSFSTSPVLNDYWTVAMTNSLSTTSLVRSLDRALSTRSRGLKFPTNGSPTIADSLIS